MLLDLTRHVPLVDPQVCRTSAVVRVRAVEENHKTAMWIAGNHKDVAEGNTHWLFHLEPSAIHAEGQNQRILDFLLVPQVRTRSISAGSETRNHVSSFRVASALPRADRPWDYQTFWIILDPGDQKLGALPRLMVDHPKHSFLIELSNYTMDSTTLPPPPNKQEQQERQTVWDRLMDD